MQQQMSEKLLAAMTSAAFYPHPVDTVELIETHISWIFLAGDYAYKVKKPVDFGFLDFTSLEKRQHYCHEELRLNRRFAPHVYLRVIDIGGELNDLHPGGRPVQEYAVMMRRFPQTAQLDRMLAAGELSPEHIDRFATAVARWHQQLEPSTPEQDYGSPGSIMTPAKENFNQLNSLFDEESEHKKLRTLEDWTRKQGKQLQPLFIQRKSDGFVRECHGDMHLANMAWLDNAPLLFDGIEFNPNLRWIDVINDIAFLLMDLDDRQQSPLGWLFLNRYLQETGDYAGTGVLNFYKVYRALVRAKVNCLRLTQADLSAREAAEDRRLSRSYLNLAIDAIKTPAPRLLLTHGFSGAGKTSFSRKLAMQFGAIHLQSDLERKRLYGLGPTDDSRSPVGGGLYSANASKLTYHRLRNLAKLLLKTGYSVLLDATFLKARDRQLFSDLAQQLRLSATILDFRVDEPVLRQRLISRAETGAGSSEATLEVLDYQLRHQQPLHDDERQQALPISATSQPEEIAARLQS